MTSLKTQGVGGGGGGLFFGDRTSGQGIIAKMHQTPDTVHCSGLKRFETGPGEKEAAGLLVSEFEERAGDHLMEKKSCNTPRTRKMVTEPRYAAPGEVSPRGGRSHKG